MSRVLRTYAIIDKTRDAELLFREVTVKPYMSEVRDLNKAKPHLATRGTAILSRFGVSLVYICCWSDFCSCSPFYIRK